MASDAFARKWRLTDLLAEVLVTVLHASSDPAQLFTSAIIDLPSKRLMATFLLAITRHNLKNENRATVHIKFSRLADGMHSSPIGHPSDQDSTEMMAIFRCVTGSCTRVVLFSRGSDDVELKTLEEASPLIAKPRKPVSERLALHSNH